MGVFYFITKQLRFARQDRLGLLLLATVVLGLLWFNSQYANSIAKEPNLNAKQAQAYNQLLDSLAHLAQLQNTPKRYPFNPNFLTDYKGYTLGMSVQEIDRLLAYRAKGLWVNSAADFKKVTQVSDSLLAQMSPYFKFPAWVNAPYKSTYKKRMSPKGPKKPLNLATPEDLQEVYGIGPVLSQRIVALRDRLGGFSNTSQLNAVYGLSEQTKDKVLESFELVNPKRLKKIEFKTASASDLATIPGISFDLAVKMVRFRRLRSHQIEATELLKIEEITPKKLELINVYLHF